MLERVHLPGTRKILCGNDKLIATISVVDDDHSGIGQVWRDYLPIIGPCKFCFSRGQVSLLWMNGLSRWKIIFVKKGIEWSIVEYSWRSKNRLIFIERHYCDRGWTRWILRSFNIEGEEGGSDSLTVVNYDVRSLIRRSRFAIATGKEKWETTNNSYEE